MTESTVLTAEEAKKFGQAFQDEEFRRLMAEYVTELADPKHREEQEAYIRQLEEQNELPYGKSLVRPSPGFVVKCTYEKATGDKLGSKNKLFLNIVHSEKVSKPTHSDRPTSSDCTPPMAGTKWSVPYAIGPVRMEYDKSKTLVPTFDCCFHPLSLQFGHKSKEFCNLIVSVAKDAVHEAFKQSGDEISLMPGYTILRGVQYKSGLPKALMISENLVNEAERRKEENEKEEEDFQESDLGKGKRLIEQIPQEKSGSKSPTISDTSLARKDYPSKKLIPEYKIVQQGVFDIAEHTIHSSALMSRRPKKLCVTFFLDNVNGAHEVSLDVSENQLELTSKPGSAVQYHLELRLPYPVLPNEGDAKFFKTDSQKLVVSLPVIPHSKNFI